MGTWGRRGFGRSPLRPGFSIPARSSRRRVRLPASLAHCDPGRPPLNPIVYAIPVFFLLMGIEWAVARARGSDTYRLGDTVASVGLGTASTRLAAGS